MHILLKLAVAALAVAVIAWLVVRTVRNARRLDERIEEYREEQEAQVRADPFAALSEVYGDKSKDKEKRDR